jgi:hypothetical protein
MHINHRRKNKFRSKGHGRRHGYIASWLAYSLRWWRRQRHRDVRARARHLIAHERYDDLPSKYPKDIYWDYW